MSGDIPYGTDYPEAPWIDCDGQPIDDGESLLLNAFTAAQLPRITFAPLVEFVAGLVTKGTGMLVAARRSASRIWR